MGKTLSNLVWIDLEMTGLDVNNEKIIEIASVITNDDLEIVAYGPELAIFQSQEVLDNMDTWCTKQHTKSGLVDRVKESKVTEQEAEKLTLDFIKSYVSEKNSPMCGNTIYMDRKFLAKYMPELENYFHYRNLDVSTLKILAKLWAKDVYDKVQKGNAHRAKDDIIESIEELKLYKEKFIVSK